MIKLILKFLFLFKFSIVNFLLKINFFDNQNKNIENQVDKQNEND